MFPKRTRTSLLLAFSAAVLTALMFLSLYFIIGVKNRKFTYEDSKNLAKELSRKVSSETEVYLSSAINSAQLVAERAMIYRKLGGTRKDIFELMHQTLLANPDFMGVWTMWEPNAFDNRDKFFMYDTLYDINGTMSFAFFKYGDSVLFERNDPTDFEQDFYTQPLKARKEMILDPFLYQYHGYDYVYFQTSAVFPVIEDSVFMGVFGIDINLDSLQAKLNRIKLYETGFLALITGSGIIVSHPDSSMINRNFISLLPPGDRIKYASLNEGKELTIETKSEFTGDQVFRFFYPVPVGRGTKPWYIMVEITVEKATVRSKQLLNTAYGIVIAGLILLLYLIINIFDRRRYEKSMLESIRQVEDNNRIISENERKMRAMFDLTNQFMGLLSPDGRLIEANRTALEFAGVELADVTGRFFWETPWWSHSPEVQNRLKAAILKAAAGQQDQFETIHLDTHGTKHHIIATLNPVFDEHGKVVLLIPNGFDITSRKKAEETLQESEYAFRNVFDKTKHGILILSKDYRILAANQAVMDMTGYKLDEEKSMKITDFVSADQHHTLQERLVSIARGDTLLPIEYKVQFRNGEIHSIQTETSVMDYYGQEAFLLMTRDVTHIKEAERKLLEAVIQTEENERGRLAQDLHDGLGPVLSTIKIYFQVFLDSTDKQKKELLAEKLKNTIEEAINSISEISHNISPHILRNYGFYAAMKQFIQRISLTNVVHINFDCEKEPDIDPNTGIVLYRTLTELINNSLKHSGCRNISVTCRLRDDLLYIQYSDDGKGFDVSSAIAVPGRGFGLHNIINRVTALQGKVDFISEPAKGLKVIIETMIKKP
jgi:PAS domain S-box-containing protein